MFGWHTKTMKMYASTNNYECTVLCKWAYSKEISTKKRFESCDTIISYFCISNLCQSAKVTVVKGFGEQGADRLQVYTSNVCPNWFKLRSSGAAVSTSDSLNAGHLSGMSLNSIKGSWFHNWTRIN